MSARLALGTSGLHDVELGAMFTASHSTLRPRVCAIAQAGGVERLAARRRSGRQPAPGYFGHISDPQWRTQLCTA
ncbi:MAG: hypothetical protein ABI137_04190 [Antricoccus sp.]